ncbi:cell division protein FtsK [Prauserella oleivorans]|uniref:Cell division protein FtsK n=1 Tax=Prauserella oleivorans TaxID=1478153 RepID=A0ABW5WAD8_9PSEU
MSVERYQPREVERTVLDAEVVPTPPARRVVQATARLVRDERTRKAGKGLARHLLYIPAGVGVVARRWWDAHSVSRYERQMRAAEAAGDQEALRYWLEAETGEKQRRHVRVMDWVQAPIHLAKAAGMILLAVAGLLLALGAVLAVASKDATLLVEPIGAAIDAVVWSWWFATAYGTVLVTGVIALATLYLWDQGRRYSSWRPSWTRTSDDAVEDVAIDESTIARALDALRIPQISSHLKQGLPLQFLVPARVDGRGTHAVVRLPAGVTAERIARRRADLATGLHRLAKEVWPTTGAEAGILDLWVADKGALESGAGPYPLLDGAEVDVFKGVPFGRTLRGEPIVAPLMERNTITGGMPGQGKSSAARVIMAGAALDPTVELRIWIPDANFDFEAFRPRCSRYVMGAEDERIAEILADLQALHAEVQRRGELLIRHGEPAVTRKLASKGIGLHPLVCLLEEAHVAIQHRAHGKEISQLLVDIVRLGRKRGIHMLVSTQAPTKDSMPRDVTRNCSNGIAFAVGDHVANDALLGQGAYAAGHRATELIPGTDRGTAVVKGFTGERSDIVQVYFLDVSKGNDEVSPIIARAVEAMRAPTEAEAGELPTLLDDIAEVMVDEVEKAAQVAARLRDRPGYSERFTGSLLVDRLHREHGIPVRRLKGNIVVRLADIHAAQGGNDT